MLIPLQGELVSRESEKSRPPDPAAGPLKSIENDDPTPTHLQVFPGGQGGQQHDNSGLAEARTRSYEEFAPLLRIAIHGSQWGRLDREDAEQEAWLVLLGHSAPRSPGGEPEGLPARIVVAIRNRLVDLRRRAERRKYLPMGDDVARSLIARDEDPAMAHERGRVRAMVAEVLESARDRVSPLDHRIIVLRWVEGRSIAEIAATLQIPASRVHDRHRRAIAVIRDLLVRRLGADSVVLGIRVRAAHHPIPSPAEVTP